MCVVRVGWSGDYGVGDCVVVFCIWCRVVGVGNWLECVECCFMFGCGVDCWSVDFVDCVLVLVVFYLVVCDCCSVGCVICVVWSFVELELGRLCWDCIVCFDCWVVFGCSWDGVKWLGSVGCWFGCCVCCGVSLVGVGVGGVDLVNWFVGLVCVLGFGDGVGLLFYCVIGGYVCFVFLFVIGVWL